MKIIVLACLFLTACTTAPSEETLVVGLQPGYPPFEYVEKGGSLVGFDVAVAEKIAVAMGKKLVIKEMNFDGLLVALKTHKIDLIISGMSITEARLKEIAMVPYYGESLTSLVLLSWQKNPAGLMVVQTGSLQEAIMKKRGTPVKSLDNIQELIMDIKYGKASGALVEPLVAAGFLTAHPEMTAEAFPLSPEEKLLGNGIGISYDNKELIKEVTAIITLMKESGEIEALAEEWFYD